MVGLDARTGCEDWTGRLDRREYCTGISSSDTLLLGLGKFYRPCKHNYLYLTYLEVQDPDWKEK